MIYIKIEMWPKGDNKRARILQEGIIHNHGGDATTGDYGFVFSKVGGFKTAVENMRRGMVKNVLRRGSITDFPRKRLYAHDLLFRALRAAFGERNPAPFVDLGDV